VFIDAHCASTVRYSQGVSERGRNALLPLLPFTNRVDVKARDELVFVSLTMYVFHFCCFVLLFFRWARSSSCLFQL
jgi:hypothetical protein